MFAFLFQHLIDGVSLGNDCERPRQTTKVTQEEISTAEDGVHESVNAFDDC